MATVANPLQYSEAVRSIMGSLVSTPQAKQDLALAQADLALKEAQARKYGTDADMGEFDLGNKRLFSDTLSQALDPQTGRILITPEIAVNLGRGKQDIGMLLASPTNSDETNAGLWMATGKEIKPDTAFSLEGQQTIADRDAGYSQQLKRMENQTSLANTNLKSRNDLIAEQYAQQVRAARFNRQPVPPPPTFGDAAAPMGGIAEQLNYNIPTGGQDVFGFEGYGGMDPMAASQAAIAQRKQAFEQGVPTPDMGLPPQGSALPWTATPLGGAQTGLATEFMGPPTPTQAAEPANLAEALTLKERMARIAENAVRQIEIGQQTGDVELFDMGRNTLAALKQNKGLSLTQTPDGGLSLESGGDAFDFGTVVNNQLEGGIVNAAEIPFTINNLMSNIDETSVGAGPALLTDPNPFGFEEGSLGSKLVNAPVAYQVAPDLVSAVTGVNQEQFTQTATKRKNLEANYSRMISEILQETSRYTDPERKIVRDTISGLNYADTPEIIKPVLMQLAQNAALRGDRLLTYRIKGMTATGNWLSDQQVEALAKQDNSTVQPGGVLMDSETGDFYEYVGPPDGDRNTETNWRKLQ